MRNSRLELREIWRDNLWMKQRLEILCDEIKQVHGQYLNEVGLGGRKVWPKAIKERVLELDRLTGSTKQTAALSGISVDT